jgi:hypothetical protein
VPSGGSFSSSIYSITAADVKEPAVTTSYIHEELIGKAF